MTHFPQWSLQLMTNTYIKVALAIVLLLLTLNRLYKQLSKLINIPEAPSMSNCFTRS